MWSIYYTIRSWVRCPVHQSRSWWKWHRRPGIGDRVRDCRHQVHEVVGLGDTEDDLVLDDGSNCSWMHCCDREGLT